MFAVETDQEMMDEENWGFEWAIVGNGGGGKGEDI